MEGFAVERPAFDIVSRGNNHASFGRKLVELGAFVAAADFNNVLVVV